MDCLFCKIIKGEIPSNKVYEDENVYAFHDINPVAPVHVIVVPKSIYKVQIKLQKIIVNIYHIYLKQYLKLQKL